MFCPNCKENHKGKFCPECGTKLVEEPTSNTNGSGVINGDANAISGGINQNDSHDVTNVDKSVHSTKNINTTTNFTNIAAQKTEIELLQEKKILYLNECKRAYEDNVLEQSEVIALEEYRIKIGLDKATADKILESVRFMSDRLAKKTTLNPIAKKKLQILTENLKNNEVRAIIDQIDSLEALVNKYEHDELQRKYFLVLAALNCDKCIEMKESSRTDNYWKSFWSYLAYTKARRIAEAENILVSLDRFADYPEDNTTLLAVAGALIQGNKDEAKEYLDAVTGDFTPALQRFADSIYLLLDPQLVPDADENTCAFYLVNFFGQTEPKEKARLKAAEEARLKAEAEAKARAEAETKRKAEEEIRRKAEAEAKTRAEAKARAEAETKRKAEEEIRRKAEAEAKTRSEAKARAEAETKRKAEEEIRRKAEAEAKTRAEAKARTEAETKRKAEEEIRRKAEAEAKTRSEAKARAEAEAKHKAAEETHRKIESEAKVASPQKKIQKKYAHLDNCFRKSVVGGCFMGVKGQYSSKITDISIPEGFTAIGKEAFYGCHKLKNINIPNSVTSIGDYAFSHCESLINIIIPNSVTSIGSNAFKDCIGLTSIEIPNSVTSIDWGAFSGCIGLTSIKIPNSVTSIGSHAFEGCIGLTSIKIPNSVTSIDWDAFSGCIGLTSIKIPNSVTKIGHDIFYNCENLLQIQCDIKDPNICHIDDYSFGLKGVTVYVPKDSLEIYRKHPVFKSGFFKKGPKLIGI